MAMLAKAVFFPCLAGLLLAFAFRTCFCDGLRNRRSLVAYWLGCFRLLAFLAPFTSFLRRSSRSNWRFNALRSFHSCSFCLNVLLVYDDSFAVVLL